MEKVLSIKYSISYFDVFEMKPGGKRIIELSFNGSLSIKDFVPGSRKIMASEKYQVKPEEFDQLYASLRQCIETADSVIQYIDDSDAKLSIYYYPERVETMPRGLGNIDHTVGSVFTEFVSRYSDKY